VVRACGGTPSGFALLARRRAGSLCFPYIDVASSQRPDDILARAPSWQLCPFAQEATYEDSPAVPVRSHRPALPVMGRLGLTRFRLTLA